MTESEKMTVLIAVVAGIPIMAARDGDCPMTPEEIEAIRKRASEFRSSGSRLVVDEHWITAADRRALLAEVDRCAAENDDLRERIKELEDAYAELAAEHFREMNEAGAELRAMERDLERAERDAERHGGMGGQW